MLCYAMLCDEPKVILGSWPTPSDEWTEEHVLQNTESRAVNLVFNRTLSLQRLANRRADVVVFADAPLDSKSYFLSFGRVAPVQARPIVCLGRSGGVGCLDGAVMKKLLLFLEMGLCCSVGCCRSASLRYVCV